ncbi:MAG: type II toxin-antitoxin system VapC family toxin [Gemmatimonadota bacterium]
MNVVDSSGWIEFFVEGPNASFFSEPLAEVETLIVPTVSILEVSRFVLRHRDEAAALEAVSSMRRGQLIELDGELALLAAKLGLEHDLPLADSIIYATAQRAGATTWTQDTDFVGLENVQFIAKGS